jgi:hypothetical protein
MMGMRLSITKEVVRVDSNFRSHSKDVSFDH